LFLEFLVQRILFSGRNGGHLTPATFLEFAQRQALFDTVEARKSYELEQHTASLLVKIMEDNGWASDVDLVEGGHIILLFTEKEEKEVSKDYEMARQTQLDLEGVEWLPKEKVQEVPLAGHLLGESDANGLITRNMVHLIQGFECQDIMSGRSNSSRSCTSTLGHILDNPPT